MRKTGIVIILAATVLMTVSPIYARQGMMPMGMMDRASGRKSPELGAMLSLIPAPIALGNFYAGDWERAIIYTTIELATFIPGVALLAEHHGHRHSYYGDHKEWTRAERGRFVYLATGFVVTKVISAFDAGYAIEQQNRRLHLGLRGNQGAFWVLLRANF